MLVQGNGHACGVEQADGDRDMQWLLLHTGLLFDADRRARLCQREAAATRRGVVVECDVHVRRARLAVPAAKDLQVARGMALLQGPLHGCDEVVTRDGLAIVTAEVLVHARAKAFLAE